MSILKKMVQNHQSSLPNDRKKTLPHLWGSHHQLDDKYSEPKKNSKIIYIVGQLTSSLQDLSSKRTRAKIHLRRAEQGQRNTRCNEEFIQRVDKVKMRSIVHCMYSDKCIVFEGAQ